jgi:hypothetical protein
MGIILIAAIPVFFSWLHSLLERLSLLASPHRPTEVLAWQRAYVIAPGRVCAMSAFDGNVLQNAR